MVEQQEGTIADEKSANDNLADSKPANNKPHKWLATALAFLYPPFGMLIVAQPIWAVVYLIVGMNLSHYASHDEHMTWGLGVALTLIFRAVAAVQAYIMAVQYPADKPLPFYSRGRVAIGIYLVLVLVLFAVPIFLFMTAYT